MAEQLPRGTRPSRAVRHTALTGQGRPAGGLNTAGACTGEGRRQDATLGRRAAGRGWRTLLGVAQALKEHDPDILIVGVEPASSPLLGVDRKEIPIIEGITDGLILEIMDSGLVDDVIPVDDAAAIQMAHRLCEQEGLFCGISSGANVHAAGVVAERLGAGKRVVTVLPDSRDRYLFEENYTT